MGGSSFCLPGGSLAVRFLLYLPTPRSPFAYSRSPTDFNTNTILIHQPAATTHQQACNTVTCKPATLPPHLCHPPYHLTSLPHLATSPLSSPPFLPCYLTSLPHLSHLATSPLSPTCPTLLPHPSLPYLSHLASPPYLSQLATSPLSPPFPPCHPSTFPNLPPHHTPTFPTLSPHCPPTFQPSQLTTLPPSQLVTLVLRDLTVAISVTRNRISHNLTKAQPSPCNTILRLQIPHTSNSTIPHTTPHIRNTPNVLTSFRQHQGH